MRLKDDALGAELAARGMYSGQNKCVLLCVLHWRTEGARLKKLVRSVDENAFVIVADVKEVLGEKARTGAGFMFSVPIGNMYLMGE